MFLVSRRIAPLLLSALVLSAAFTPAHAQPVAASVAVKNKTELAFRVKEDNRQQIWRPKLVSAIDFKLSAPAWKLMLGREGVVSVARLSSNLAEYAEEHGIGNLDKIESGGGGGNRSSNQPKVDALIKKLKSKIGVTVEATQSQISPTEGALLIRYVNRVGQLLADEEFTPQGARAQIKLVFSSAAEDIEVSSTSNNALITILAPTSEPDGWDDKIKNGLKRFGKEG